MYLTSSPDGSFWIDDSSTTYNKVMRVDADGTTTEFNLPTRPQTSPTDDTVFNEQNVAVDSSGNAWVGLFEPGTPDDAVPDRITPQGVISQFPIPGTDHWNIWLTTGPDGAVWFTDPGAREIGRVSLDGVITLYPVPDAGDSQIIAGPDGALWINDYQNKKVGRITLSGSVSYFSVPVAPEAIAAGPDGDVWIGGAQPVGPPPNGPNQVQQYEPDFVRITPTGAMTEMAVPGALNSTPRFMTFERDGTLWYDADSPQGGSVDVLNRNGEVQEFPIPHSGNANNPVVGADGHLWFIATTGSWYNGPSPLVLYRLS